MLFSDTRRSKRYITLLPVTIYAVDIQGNHVDGSLPGRIIDLSNHGASLFLTRVMAGSYHIFFSVQENSGHLLCISFLEHDAGKDEDIILKARPIWMNSYDEKDLVAFKMGVEFTERPDRREMSRLKQAMKNQMAAF